MIHKVIVGLGNPGEKYKNTRHNAGFLFVEQLAEKHGSGQAAGEADWKFDKKFNAEICKLSSKAGDELLLAKPQTYMNKSGDAVSKIVNYFNLDLNNLVVAHDDVDLDYGQTKFKKSMGAAGHHGVEDIIEKIGSKDFWRLRIGIGRPKDNRFDVHDFVLGKFDSKEMFSQIAELNNL